MHELQASEGNSESSDYSIVMVNYKTLQLTSSALEFLRKAIDVSKVPVWVVDNYSGDESTEYLRSLDWIHLIERSIDAPETGALAHGRALDMVLERVNTKYLLLMHTDTFLYDASIIQMMLNAMKNDPTVFAVGCIDQIDRGWLRTIWRHSSRFMKHYSRKTMLALGFSSRQPKPYYEVYLKSFCALWNVEIIKAHAMHFSMSDRTPGYEMQDRLTSHGYKIVYIPPRKMFRYLDHVQSGTVAAAGTYGKGHRRTRAYQSILKKIGHR
jgi:GT2 family glycosyltransferase